MRQGILLTGAESQTIVEVSGNTKMRLPGSTNRRNPASLGQVFACILLVGLFLYNPFLAAGRASGNLMVCHPASHRGTVGSSELEQFAQPNGGVAALLPEVAEGQPLLTQVAENDCASQRAIEEVIVVAPQTGFSSSLWFRPPPAA
jgi:hypothetical protein